jgi:PspA associated protein B
VGLGDVLFGRKKLKGANLDKLFALSTAAITLESEAGLKPAGVAAVVFKPLSAGEFVRAESDLDELLGVATRDSGSRVRRRSDSFGFEWIVIHDKDFEDLVTTTHLVSSELSDSGFGGQLLAAVFAFLDRKEDRPVYLIYGYKRGTFWPFVPKDDEEQERDNPEEMRLKNVLESELPIEPDLTRWLALFNAPLDE